jgi:hypothetical protein
MKITLTTLLFFIAAISFAGKKPLINEKEKVIEKARMELDSAVMQPAGKIFLLAEKNEVRGSFVFDISIREKGEVASVFVVERLEGDIKSQNMLKDIIKDFKFDFKMPKGKSYKFQYTFKFN